MKQEEEGRNLSEKEKNEGVYLVQVETFQEEKERPVVVRKMNSKSGRSESMGRLKREKSIDLQLE